MSGRALIRESVWGWAAGRRPSIVSRRSANRNADHGREGRPWSRREVDLCSSRVGDVYSGVGTVALVRCDAAFGLPQRGCVSKPWVARHELRWVPSRSTINPGEVAALVAGRLLWDATPSGLGDSCGDVPRVGSSPPTLG